MPTIGYATLQIIPSLDGVSEAVDKQLDGKLRVSGKRGGKQLAKGVGEGLKDLEREVESTGRAYQKLKDRAADALGKVRTEEAALKRLRDTGASDDRIIRAEERLATARRNSSRANREASDSHTVLLNAQKRLGDGNDDLGRKFSSMSNLAGTAGTALAAAGAVAGGVALAGIAALGAGVLVAGNRLYDLGAQFDDTFDNIRIKTGATGPALEALEAATKKLATSVPLGIGEIGNVVAETNRALHLTGPELDNVAGSIANLGRLTGESVDVRTLGKAFRGFGVDAKDQIPALDGLFRASQATGIGVNELLATVVKGGAGLRQFGFDFGESAALATQFEEAGLDADKAMTGLTKGLATLAKDGKTGKDALQGTVTEIQNLINTGQDAAALELTNKLFGARGGVQFFEAIKNGTLDLQALNNALAGTGDTIAAAAADTDDWSERWQTFKNTIAVALEPVATSVFDSVNAQLTNLADWVAAHKVEVIDFFVAVGDAAITMSAGILKAVGLTLDGFGQLAGGLGNVVGGMLKVGSGLQRLTGDTETADEWLREAEAAFAWGESLQAAGQAALTAADNVDPLRVGLRNAGDAAKTAGTDADGAATKVTGLGTALGALPPEKLIGVAVDTGQAAQDLTTFRDFFGKSLTIPVNVNLPPGAPFIGPGTGRASGGPITGPGGPKSDIIPIWASNGEHMLSAKDVAAMGGQSGVYAFRSMLHRNTGGEIDWLEGERKRTPGWVPHGNFNPNMKIDTSMASSSGERWFYKMLTQGLGVDPGMTERVGSAWHMGRLLDMISGGAAGYRGDVSRKHPVWPPMKFAEGGAIGPDVLAARELVGTPYSQANRTDCSGMVARVIARTLGMSESGLMSTKTAEQWLAERGFVPGIGGPGTISVGWYDHGPNPNDGHMAMTLSDGRNAEAGGSSGPFTIGSTTGASSPQFDQHMHLPTVYGEGPAGSSSASSPFAGGSAAAAVTGAAPTSSSGGATSSSVGGGGGISLPSSLSGFGSFAGGQLGDLLSAAGSFIDGQVSSVLDVFGVPDSPGWLKAISTFVGGLSFGGGDGSSLPLSAAPMGTGTPPPDDPGNMHGSRAGQRPGPTYYITARDTEDAFIKAQRVERERAAAKLSRF